MAGADPARSSRIALAATRTIGDVRAEALGVLDAGAEVVGDEVAVPPVPLGPAGVERQGAGEGPLVEGDARDHADVALAAEREQLVLGGLVEDVVDHLHRVHETFAHEVHYGVLVLLRRGHTETDA